MMKKLLFLLLLPLQMAFAAPVALIGVDSPGYQAVLQALKKLGHEVDTFDLASQGKFPEEKLFDYRDTTVIRLVDSKIPASGISSEEGDIWTDFLASMGTLILIADQLRNTGIMNSIMPEYTGLHFRKTHLKTHNILGQASDLISDDLNFQADVDADIDLMAFHEGNDIVLKADHQEVLGVKKQSCGFRMSAFSFKPEWLKASDLRKLLGRAVDWNMGHALVPGHKAPDFPVLALNGETTGLYNLIGSEAAKPLVLEFMATWCHFCADQLPAMAELRAKYDGKVDFVFINYRESPEKIRDYLAQHPEIDWPVYITEDGYGALRYGVKALPGIFILDASRTVRFIRKKVTSADILENAIDQVLIQSRFEKLHQD